MHLVAKCRRHRVPAFRIDAEMVPYMDWRGEVVKLDASPNIRGTYWLAPHQCDGQPSGFVDGIRCEGGEVPK